MSASPLSAGVVEAIRRALLLSWSGATSVCFNPDIAPRSYGQCAPTAVVIFERFGGEILRTNLIKHDGSSIRHFYNRIGGERYDFTADQLHIPDFPDYYSDVTYGDYPSSASEAATEMLPGQLHAMRLAFSKAYEQHAV